jgi:histidine ammonia-lyase
MMLLRANSLAKGHSGVRAIVIDTLCEMLNRGVTSVCPVAGQRGRKRRSGSPGASGAGVDRRRRVHGRKVGAFQRDSLKQAQIKPLVLEAKESISLINGTQAMLAVGTLALLAAESWPFPPTCWAVSAATRSKEPTWPSMNASTRRALTPDK